MQDKILTAIVEMREDEALALTREALAQGANPLEMLELFRQAVEEVGKRYEKGEYFLPELMMTGQMMNQLAALTKKEISEISPSGGGMLGRVLIGTVKGDIHDIGKNIVTFMLDANGFEVLDIGVDIPAEKFVEAALEFKPQIIGLSALLTLAFDPMKATIEALEKAGIRQQVKIMVGGAPVDEQVCRYAGADGYGRDAVEAVNLAKKWVGGQ